MDSLDINKMAAAGLTAGIAFFVTGLLGSVLVSQPKLEKLAIKIDEPAPKVAANAPAGPAPVHPIEALLASADVSAGEAYAQKACAVCHSFNEGGKAGVGPNLYGVVGGPHGHMEGYPYSAVLKSHQEPWTYAELNKWLYKPSAYAPGTKMGFVGITSDKERANVIDYLRSLAKEPVPMPSADDIAKEAKSAEVAAPAPAQVASSGAPAAPAAEKPFAVLLASASAENGQKLTQRQGCVACHTFTEGGKAGLGPNLYGVVGAPHGHMDGYPYSSALKGKEGPWTYDELNQWLTKPAAYAPGTKMSYAGDAKASERADIIAYLKSISPNAPPIPQASASGASGSGG